MEALLSDLSLALRTARRNPGFSLAAVLTLALGIGAVSTMVSVVETVLLTPFPFRDPRQLVMIWGEMRGQEGQRLEVSPEDYLDWRQAGRSFTGLAALASTDSDVTYTGGDRPLHLRGRLVSADFFDVLGSRAALGRTLVAADDRPAAPSVVVLSHSFWRRHLGGDAAIVGRQIRLDGDLTTVVGVMPPAFRFPAGADLWAPLGPVFAQPSYSPVRFLAAVGRLRPDTSLTAARQDMALVSSQLAGKRPHSNRGYGALLVPLLDEILGDAPRTLWMLLGAVGLLLLIACANVAGLLVARAAARRKETAVQSALGAGRSRIARQLLTEGALLAAAAAALGLGLAWGGLRLLVAVAPGDIPRLDEVRLDSTGVGITLAVAAATVLLFALAPVAARGPGYAALREGGRASPGSGASRLRAALVVAQVALALVLLVGAGLLGRSFLHLRGTDLGFVPENLLTFRVTLPSSRYPEAQGQAAFFREALARAASLPGAEGAGLVLIRPLSGPVGWDFDFTVFGQTAEQQARNPAANHQRVSPGYFATMGIRLVAGRDFTWGDSTQGQRVVIVNRSTARRFWPGQDPLGQRLRFGPFHLPTVPANDRPRWFTVVGVVGDVRYRDLGPPRVDLYVPFLQAPYPAMDLVVRTRVPPLSLADDAARAIQAIDPEQAVAGITTMDEALAGTLARPRLRSALLGTFAVLALLLAAVGLYGLLAYAVHERRRELGIRMALGADRPALLLLVLRFGLGLTGIGLALGLALAFLLAGSGPVDGLLAGIETADRATFAAVPALLLAVAALACLLPAWQATKADPRVVLREE